MTTVATASPQLPELAEVSEVAAWLRTSRKSIYAMVERGQIPGAVRVNRRLLFDVRILLRWLDEKRAVAGK